MLCDTRPQRPVKINTARAVILKNPSVFSAESTVVIQWRMEDHGSDHRESTYTTWVTKTGRIITHNIKHICATPISVEQYLHDQIRKATGQL